MPAIRQTFVDAFEAYRQEVARVQLADSLPNVEEGGRMDHVYCLAASREQQQAVRIVVQLIGEGR